MNRRFRLPWLVLLSLSAFVLFLNGPDIVTSHEARVAQPARVMAASGWPWAARFVEVPAVKLQAGIVRLLPDWDSPPVEVNPWLVPVMNGQVRLQKPPLPYWCAAITFRLCGGFSEGTLRIVPALLGMLATFFMFDLGRMLYGRRIGWLAALAWVSTYSIPEQYRKAMADPYLAFFTLGCLWSWVRAGKSERRKDGEAIAAGSAPLAALHRSEMGGVAVGGAAPTRSRSSHPSIFVLLFYVSFGFALLAKGPPAFVDILLPLMMFHVCVGTRVPGRAWVHGVGVLLMLGLSLPWAVYVWQNVPHAMELWRYESLGELGDNNENARSWWFYGPQLFYLALPWTALWLVGIARQAHRFSDHIRRKTRRKTPIRHFFPLFWSIAMVSFFSCVNLKKNQYLLPALPAQTLLIAQGLAVVLAGARKTRLIGRAGALIVLQVFMGIAFGVAILVMMFKLHHPLARDLVMAGLALGAALLSLRSIIARRPRTWVCIQAAAYVLLGVVFIRCYLTPKESERSAKYVAAEMWAISRQSGWTLFPGRLPEEVAVYLPADVRFNFFARHVLVALDDQHGVRYRELHHLPMPVPQIQQFAGFIPDAQLDGVRQVKLASAPGDARWKVYELIVSRSGLAMR